MEWPMSTAIHDPPPRVRVGRLVPIRRRPPALPRAEPTAPQSGEVHLLLSLGLGGAACLAGLALAGLLLMPPGSGAQTAMDEPAPRLAAAIVADNPEPTV